MYILVCWRLPPIRFQVVHMRVVRHTEECERITKYEVWVLRSMCLWNRHEWMVYFSQWLTNGYRIFIEWVIAILRMHRICERPSTVLTIWTEKLSSTSADGNSAISDSSTLHVASERQCWTVGLCATNPRSMSTVWQCVCVSALRVCAVYLHKVSVRRELSTAVLQRKCTFEIRCKSFINIFIRNCARGGRDGRAVTFSHSHPLPILSLFLFNIFLLILQSFRCQWTSEMWTHTHRSRPKEFQWNKHKHTTACFVLRQIVSSSRRRTDLYGAINEKSIEIVSH